MTTYTAEDFANAEFARHPDGRIAARVDNGNLGWWAGGSETAEPSWRDDDDMAEEGFVPVRESQPITLDALRDAWETAEEADECNEGDILILRRPNSPTKRVSVWRSERPGRIGGYTRILHRAPKRPEGAEAIEEVLLKEWLFDGSDEAVADLADRLARRGVTVSKNAQE